MASKGSKWAKLRDQYPKLPLDADYSAKIEAILNAPIPDDDLVAAGISNREPLRAMELPTVVKFYNFLRDEIKVLEDELSTMNAKLEAAEFKIGEHFEANDLLTQKFEDGSSITVAPDPVVSVANEVEFYSWVKADELRKVMFKLREYINPQTAKAQVKALLETNEPVPPGVEVFYLNKLTRRSG